MTVYVLATLDTKGREAAFVRDRLMAAGVAVRLVDTGCLGEPLEREEISREVVFAAAGTTLAAARARGDRGEAVAAAARGVEALARRWLAAGDLQGVIGLGGGAGTTIGTSAMRALPIGVPKLMVSTLASGQVAHYVQTSDILMMNAVVDISGLNRISRAVLTRAADAMAGMAQGGPVPHGEGDKPLVAASMFGVTTPCVERARAKLEAAGYEVLVFHATGTGGRTLEALAASGMLAGVLDLTTTELADELVGGVLTAGPERLTAATRAGIPQVVSVGALDMVNFHGRETVPAKFHDRTFYQHNANVTLMRTTPEECLALGREIGSKLARDVSAEFSGETVGGATRIDASSSPQSRDGAPNSARGAVATILFPKRGVSAIDRPGQPFDDPIAREALLTGLRATHGDVPLVELDLHINDIEFADRAADALLAMLRARVEASPVRNSKP